MSAHPTPSPADVADLASVADAASKDTYLSLYVDLLDPRSEDEIDARARRIRALLPKDERSAFDESLAKAEDLLAAGRGTRPVALAIFTSAPHGFARAFTLHERVPTRLVLDSGPYVRPLARHLDENEAYVLVLVDGENAEIHHVAAGESEKLARNRIRLIGRHKKGGMSQMRYQRHRQGRVNSHFDEVCAQLDRILRETRAPRVLLAGPGQAKRELEKRMTIMARERLVAIEDAELDDPELMRTAAGWARAEEKARSKETLGEVLHAIRRDELAIAGPLEVVRAARDGRVETLVIRKGHEAGGRKCEAHQSYFLAAGACACGNKGTEVDLLNEAIEHASRAEAEIEFVEDADRALAAEGIAATLRW